MFDRVLVTTDGSRFAEEAVSIGVSLAKECGAEVRAVSVVENPVFYGTPEATALYDAEFYRALAGELEKLANAATQRVEGMASKAGVKCTGAVRHGAPADEVLAEAKAWKADAIVISTHGRSGLSRLLLGSVANRIVNHAECPVLLHRVKTER